MPRNTDTNTRYSVCIGINTYVPETGLGALNYAENDARSMDEMLGKRGFLPENRILLLGEAATLDAVNTALGTMIFDRSKENDLVVVYFAGHSTPVTVEDSLQVRRSEVFLATSDFNRQLIQDSPFFRLQYSLGMERLRRTFFEGPGSRKRLFIFDSCYSGDFYGPDYRNDIDQVPSYVQDMLNSSTNGRIFIASCLPYQKAAESSVYGHGHFTYYLLQALGGERDALRQNGTLTAGSLFDYLDDKLQNQKPVKGGVEFGSFELARFPVPPIVGIEQTLDESRQGKEARLNSMHIDQQDFVRDRLQRFVGRQTELTELRTRIDREMERGGYVIVTGDAGQGKTSIIAKLLEEYGLDSSAYHFIPFSPGRDYQINIVRTLMARLLLKYDLPERYIAGESYPILRDYFRRTVDDIAKKRGKREVIFIDGLDQLEMDVSGLRDISFLPSSLPPGIVIIVGTRPNKTLKEVERLTRSKPDNQYRLQGLSREDFDLLLRARRVSLSAALSDSLYLNLKRNALYLDLVAQELLLQHHLRSEELIARLANNPDDIFTITFSRMQRLPEWYEVIRPLLGALLVAQEALTSQQIAHIFQKEDVHVRAGMTQLGGLLTQAGQQKYALFHPKLFEYLKQDPSDNDIQFTTEEVEDLHAQVAQWCEQGTREHLWLDIPDASPRDDYREYARRHYITHLYKARKDERLFTVLNDGQYEREKLRFDRSTRSTAADLKLACQAAAREAAMLAKGKELLTYLWHYTLLRTNLTTRADAYPIEAFQALLALGREGVAFNLVELLTQPARKLEVLILLTEYLLQQPTREAEGIQLYTRVYEIAVSVEESGTQARALSSLVATLVRVRQLTRAESVAYSIAENDTQAKVLSDISDAYGKQSDWTKAQDAAHAIAVNEERVSALSNLAARLKLAHEEEQSETLWQEASAIVSSLADNDQRSRAIYHLSVSFMQAKEWERAETAAQSIEGHAQRVNALCQLALSFTQEGLAARAEAAWEEARTVIEETREKEKITSYKIYAIALSCDRKYSEAEAIANRYLAGNPTEKVTVFRSLASNLMKEGLWEHSKRVIDLIMKEYDLTDVAPPVLDEILIPLSTDLAQANQWDLARETASALPRQEAQCRALMGIAGALARAGLQEMAHATWEEARAMITTHMDGVQTSVTSILVSIFVEVGQTEQAWKIIPTLADKQTQENIIGEIGLAFARMGHIAEAEKIAHETTNPKRKVAIQQSIAVTQIKAGQYEQAIATVRCIPGLEKQSHALVDLVTTCCQMQQWKLAQETARQIQSSDLQARAITHIVDGLVQAGRVKEAETIARSIGNEFLKANALCDFATMLAKTGRFNEATRVARSMKRNERIQQKAFSNISIAGLLGAAAAETTALAIDAGEERDEALYNVAATYAHDNVWDEAEKIAKEISEEPKRDEAWAAIARERAQAGQWPQAITALDKIQGSKPRLSVLQAWGTLLPQPADQHTRARIVQHLSDSKEKASFLVSVADALAQAGHYLEQIRLTQQAWLQADTKDDCQYLFAMVQRLLPHHPEMCVGFYESFGWVDTFLSA